MRGKLTPRQRYLQLGLELLGLAVALYGVSRVSLVLALIVGGLVAAIAAQFPEEWL